MLEIQAITYNDLAPVVPISGLLPEEGGTLGRSDENAIVLPDPMRLVSRQHLQISPEGKERYRVVNISGANMVYINSTELFAGGGCLIKPGDKICIGGYVLRVVEHQSNDSVQPTFSTLQTHNDEVESDDFLAGFLGDSGDTPKEGKLRKSEFANMAQTGGDSFEALMQTSTSPQQGPVQSITGDGVDLRSLGDKGDGLLNGADFTDHSAALFQESSQVQFGGVIGSNSVDPLALFGTDASHTVDFGAIGMDVSQPLPSGTIAASISHGSDLENLFQAPALAQADLSLPSSKLSNVSTGAYDLDEYFAPLITGNGTIHAPAKDDPLADLLRADLAVAPQAHPHADSPMLGAALDFHSTKGGGRAMQSVDLPQKSPTALLDESPLDQSAHGPLSGIFGESIGNALPEAAVATLAFIDPEPTTAFHRSLSPAAIQAFAAKSADIPEHSAHQDPQVDPDVNASEQQLYQALLQGLGLKEIPDRSHLDVNFMCLIGQLLRCASQGTVDLMAGRAVVKREVKANVTLIAPERNNPLKFSPDGEVALMYLLGRTYPGFMQPAEAMNGAYLDLRAHQIGLVSGMRSALGHVLDKFDPTTIDNDTIEGGMFSSFGHGRKAKLWDAYGRYYTDTRNEAEDRFQEFFGASFLKAYEEATQTLKLSQTHHENGAAQ